MNYDTLIFDLDDTLIDNYQSISYAFFVMISNLGIKYDHHLFLKWLEFDNTYWSMWECGKMELPKNFHSISEQNYYLRSRRFQLFFNNLDISDSMAFSLNDIYTNNLGVNIVLIDGAYSLLDKLYSKYDIVIATNGPEDVAFNKIERANIKQFISTMISSEKIGFSKPSSKFFDVLFEKIKQKDKKKLLFIGDSLTTDILGGMNNGIDTCWFNPKELSHSEEYSPTYEIHKLIQLEYKL